MALTRDFRATIMHRTQQDAGFRQALLKEGVDALLHGDMATGKALLRDYIKATGGFRPLSEATGIHAKSLMRMFGPSGNPRAENLFAVLAQLQQREAVQLEVQPVSECAVAENA